MTLARLACSLLLLIALLIAAPPAAVLCAEDAAAAARPNILFIMTDQHRWDCIGANGNRLIRTPNLDRLAGGGANFTHAFVASPVCVPSRISFFTGRYAHAHRNRVNYTPLDSSEVMIQARLRDAGYATAAVGKLHFHPPSALAARQTGFDIVELHDGVPYLDRFSDYVAWRNEHDPNPGVSYRAIAKNIPAGENPYRAVIADEYSDTTWVGQRTCHHLEQLAAGDKPFFLFSSFWKPHSPFEVCAPFDSAYDGVTIPLPPPVSASEIGRLPEPLQKLILRGRPAYDMDRERLEWAYRSYYGTITHVDREIGRILDTLAASGEADDTIVVFSSDHGDQMLEHGLMGKNCFYDSSVRVPLIFRYPRRIREATYDDLVETVDVLPTLFELAGLPEPYNNQGRSLAPLIADAGRAYQPREAVFSENIIPEVITNGGMDFMYIKGEGVKGILHPDAKMVRTERWKYNYYPEGYAELYDLKSDPHETINLARQTEHRETEYAMKDRLLHWLTTVDDADQIAPKWLVPE